MSEQKKFTLATEDGMNALLEHVANGVLDGTLVKGQADPINTTAKLKYNFLKLKKDYLQLAIEVYKAKIRKGEMDPDALFTKLPHFFDQKEFARIEQRETDKEAARGQQKKEHTPRHA